MFSIYGVHSRFNLLYKLEQKKRAYPTDTLLVFSVLKVSFCSVSGFELIARKSPVRRVIMIAKN